MANDDEAEKLNDAFASEDHEKYKSVIEHIMARQPDAVREKTYKFYKVSQT